MNKLDWLLEVEPELYETHKYQIRNIKYGLYTKKEAELICEFLRQNGVNLIYDSNK